ncbi:transcription-repair coupling factor [Sporanaerobium hydrogeniformans]|uniref:transcription-repair coupling factor n=1 Tax=Sporanaerobium hydrogeniformans TaxID=3072179 RepID=UPI0027E3EB47|nr:transcription-repair coupling factor [Sporanaerobium hydrogeniformans]
MDGKHQGLIEPLKALEGMQELLQALLKKQNVKVINMVDACKAHFLYAISEFVKASPIIITYDEGSTRRLTEDLQFLIGSENIYVYPARDILFYSADVHSMDITSARIRVIEALNEQKKGAFIIPIEALLNPLSPQETWRTYSRTLHVGDVIDLAKLEAYLVEIGYSRVAKVEGMGQFAVRGGIIDIYTPIDNEPYRLELWDDELDSIRAFNVQTQRSIHKIDSLKIVPNQEIIFPLTLLRKAIPSIREEMKLVTKRLREEGHRESAITLEAHVKESIEQIENDISPKGLELYVPYTELATVSLLDYIKPQTILYLDEPLKSEERANRILKEYEESMKDRLQYGHILPKQIELMFTYEDIAEKLAHFPNLLLMNLDREISGVKISKKMSLKVYENNTFYKSLDLLEKDIKEWKRKRQRIIILSGSKTKAQKLGEELEDRGVFTAYSESLQEAPLEGQILIAKGALGKGFFYEEIGLHIVADKDLFGKEKNKKPRKKYQGAKIQSFLELNPGDYVVDELHGIGIFKGVEQIVIEGISRDNLKIEYADNSTLYVNINQMDRIQKYIGAEGKVPKLNKIGSSDWKKSKAKVKKAIQDIAKDLIKLYSTRQHLRGFVYDKDTLWQKEFEEMFPYEETDDQLQAVEEVKTDMESTKIMDRLICGDVGYGKTEVAIRAAFKAVQNNKQVAYLVPTTILAQQHYNRFLERMEGYPVNVGLLSRFRTPKQMKETLEGLNKGLVDIVIGTHRLLSADVKFKDLGLVIIDEEQRFGVTHKEKLKQMRHQVDVMTLTATPIPRTLHMSLIGVRDMSVLEEAPMQRKPIQTYVIEYSEDFIKDAINRELSRGGQVYFLHNQVKNIEEKTERIRELIPHAKIAFAHGQMSERELEKIMLNFIEKEIDILVCTTIIETGLDISNVNTIIINHADKMGLSQLYQLRGRVGRSDKMGYAYLMYEKNKVLKEIAEKRLQAIKQFTELGAGFKIAMRDLEIRGAGNLLGAQQHGHMEAIGYDLYCKMLAQVVSEEQGEVIEEEFETTIEIKIDAYIPSDYIFDEVQKLDIYKKIASIQNDKDYYDIQEEIEDRYGNLPCNVQNLLDIALIKALAHELYIVAVSEIQQEVCFKFKPDAKLNPDKLLEVMQLYPRKLKFVGGKEPSLKWDLTGENRKDLLVYIKNILQELKKLKS